MDSPNISWNIKENKMDWDNNRNCRFIVVLSAIISQELVNNINNSNGILLYEDVDVDYIRFAYNPVDVSYLRNKKIDELIKN